MRKATVKKLRKAFFKTFGRMPNKCVMDDATRTIKPNELRRIKKGYMAGQIRFA